MCRMLISNTTKLIFHSRLQNNHIPSSAVASVKHANTNVSLPPARLFFTSQPHKSALPEKSTNDHVKVWISEKLVSTCLIPVIPWALMYPNNIGDSLLATLIGMHVFIGLGAIQHDYVRPDIYGKFITNVARALVCLITLAVLGGFFYLIQHDIGLANILERLWGIKGGSKSSPPPMIPASTGDSCARSS